MSKKYTNYSRMAKEDTPEIAVESVINDSDFDEVEEETIVENSEESVSEDKVARGTITGTVVGCEKLNVRKVPFANGEIVCVIAKGSIVVIDEIESTDEWYKVCVENGAEGFCMKKFVNAVSL